MELTITIGIIIVLLLLLVMKLNTQRYTKEGIPIVGNIPWLGCGVSLKKNGARFIRDCRKKYGDVFQLYAGGKEFNFVFHESYYNLFYNGSESEVGFYEGIKDNNSQFHFDDILGVKKETPEERKEVSAIRPIRTFLQDYSSLLTDNFFHPNFEYLFENAGQQQKTNVNEKKFTLDIVDLGLYMGGGLAACAFGGFEIAKNPEFIAEYKKLSKASFAVATGPKIFAKKNIQRCAETRKVMRKIIEDCVQQNKSSPFSEYLLNTYYQCSGRKYGIDEVGYIIFSMIYTAMSNASASIVDVLVDLLVYPEIKKKVMDELNEVIVNDPLNRNVEDGKWIFNQEMINKLEYLQCCVNETLRLHSPPLHVRKLQIDLKGEDSKVLIPKGAFICTSPWVRHREESVFENAELYDPTRFAKGVKQKRFSYITFGIGRHLCLGKFLSETIVRYTIAYLLLHFDIKLPKDETSTRNPDPKVIWFGFGVLKPAIPIHCQFEAKY